MVGKMAVLLLVVAGGLSARAEDPACVKVYRQAYMDFARSSSPDAKLSEANETYKIYFDYSNGVRDAYVEAQRLFQALAVRPEQEQLVLATLKVKMEQGALCGWFSSPMRFSEVVEVLRPSVATK